MSVVPATGSSGVVPLLVHWKQVCGALRVSPWASWLLERPGESWSAAGELCVRVCAHVLQVRGSVQESAERLQPSMCRESGIQSYV